MGLTRWSPAAKKRMPTFIHLRVQVSPDKVKDFKEFLERAIPYYEQPGGITIRLLRNLADSTQWIEVVEYATEADYAKDQVRIEDDPKMRDLLTEWRQLLAEPPVMEVWRESRGDE